MSQRYVRLTVEEREFPLLYKAFEPPNIRARLHTICALYAHTPQPERRHELLDALEKMTLELAAMMAQEMLESGLSESEAAV
jgi:hypothetical protein